MAPSTTEVSGERRVHHVTGCKDGRRGRAPKASKPMTAMIDVTFLLLLFFLLTLTFRQAEGVLPGTLPGGGHEGPGVAIVIDVVTPQGTFNGDAGVFFIENDRFDNPELLCRELERRQAVVQLAGQSVVIKPAPGVRWQHVVDAFNQGTRAKYKKIGFQQ